MSYQARPFAIPETVKELAEVVSREFQAVEEAAENIDVFIPQILHIPPAKFVAGMVVYADGSDWNPSNGEGLYRRNAANTLWVPVGAGAGGTRERLSAFRNYFMRPDGNDANDGLSNTPGGAWLTVNKAYNYVRDNIDFNGNSVQVSIADGTYTAGLNTSGKCVGQAQPSQFSFVGNTGSPGNVLFDVNSSNVNILSDGGMCMFSGMEFRTTGSGNCIVVTRGASIWINTGIIFGACANTHIVVTDGGLFLFLANYTISGGAQRHYQVQNQGIITSIGVITITTSGTPAFSLQFVLSFANGLLSISSANVTWAGTGATGTRFIAQTGGGINSSGGGINYFPGSIAGAATAPGWYA